MSPQKSISGKDLNEAVTSDDVLGKEVIDADGRFIGITEKVFIHPKELEFMGISVDKGFLKKGLSIASMAINLVCKLKFAVRIFPAIRFVPTTTTNRE